MPFQIAGYYPVDAALADRDFVDADHLRPRLSRSAQLLAHVLFVEVFDRPPIQPGLFGDVLDRHGLATASYEEGEAFGIEWVVRQPVQRLLLHLAATLAVDAPDFEIQVNPDVPAGQIAHSAYLVVVPGPMDAAARPASRFFPRRRSSMTRAFRSPKMPRTAGSGTKPGKRYASRRYRCFRMPKACQFSRTPEMPLSSSFTPVGAVSHG